MFARKILVKTVADVYQILRKQLDSLVNAWIGSSEVFVIKVTKPYGENLRKIFTTRIFICEIYKYTSVRTLEELF